MLSSLLPILAEIGEPADGDKASAIEPLRWFIARAVEPKGLPLTALGNVGAKVVQEADERFKWYVGRSMGWKPRTDQDLGEVIALRELATRMRLVRKQRSALLATKRGAALLDDLTRLWDLAVRALLAPPGEDPTFVQDAREVLLMMLLLGGDTGAETDVHSLQQVSGRILASSWQPDPVRRRPGDPVEWDGYFHDLHDAIDPLRAIGMLNDNRVTASRDPWQISLTPVGTAAAAIALRERLAPRG